MTGLATSAPGADERADCPATTPILRDRAEAQEERESSTRCQDEGAIAGAAYSERNARRVTRVSRREGLARDQATALDAATLTNAPAFGGLVLRASGDERTGGVIRGTPRQGR